MPYIIEKKNLNRLRARANIRGHSGIYSNQIINGTVTTIKTITGDSDSLLEVGEKMQIHIDLKQINSAHVKLAHTVHKDVCGEPYMSIRLEIRPVVGALLTIEKEIPAVNTPVMTLQ